MVSRGFRRSRSEEEEESYFISMADMMDADRILTIYSVKKCLIDSISAPLNGAPLY